MIKVASDADRVAVAKLQEDGQGQIFRFWDELSLADQKVFLAQIRDIDLPKLKDLVRSRYLDYGRRSVSALARLGDARSLLRLADEDLPLPLRLEALEKKPVRKKSAAKSAGKKAAKKKAKKKAQKKKA